MKTLRFWWNNARPMSLPMSVLPSLVAIALASHAPDFSVVMSLLAVVGVVCAHLCINLADDYFDYKKKSIEAREAIAHRGMRARMGKYPYLTSGEATPGDLLFVTLIFAVAGLLIGVAIFSVRGVAILYIALATAVLGFSYSGGLLRLSYRGLSGVTMGIMFGPIMMSGVYYSAAGSFSLATMLVSVSTGLLMVNIAFVHDIMDYEPDKEVGKITLAVLLGSRFAMKAFLGAVLLSIYGVIIAGVLVGSLPLSFLVVLITTPMAFALFKLVCGFIEDPYSDHARKFWMGPMPNWEALQQAGISWFMIRWYLARNLKASFCILLLATSIVW